MTDIFLDSARSKMDFAGVLEVDDESAYFYLCSIDGIGGSKIIESINIGAYFCDTPESDFQIIWNEGEDSVAILVGNEVVGVFRLEDGSGSSPTFHRMLSSQITADVKRAFQRH